MRLTGVRRIWGMSLVIEVVAFMCSLGTGFQGMGAPRDGVQTALVVNGHEVSGEEFRWFMEQERGGVFRYFKTKHHLEDGQGFWGHEIEGTTPKAVLQSNSVVRISREKVEQILFQELGLVKDISYTAFLAQLDKLNEERGEAARQGRAVYGPVRYTQLQFYEHWKARLRVQAKEKLADKQWAPSAQELRRFYDEHQALFQAQPSFNLEVVTVRAHNEADTGTVRSAAEGVLARLKAGSALTNLLKEPPPGDNVRISRRQFVDISADRLGELFPEEKQVEVVLALPPGGTVLLVCSDGEARVVRCLAQQAGEVRPYEAVQSQVRERWVDQQYERHLERRARQAKVKVNREAVAALLP